MYARPVSHFKRILQDTSQISFINYMLAKLGHSTGRESVNLRVGTPKILIGQRREIRQILNAQDIKVAIEKAFTNVAVEVVMFEDLNFSQQVRHYL